MKLATPFKILAGFLNAFNHKDLHTKNAYNNSQKYNYWYQECSDHPTNNSCLIYCD